MEAVLGVPAQERRRAAALSAFFFIVVAVFWIQKPLRTSLFLIERGVESLPYAKLASIAAVVPAMALYAAASRRLRRPASVAAACTAAFAAAALAFAVVPSSRLGHYAYWVYVDVYVTVMVALSWTIAHDLSRPSAARRTYAWVGAGGIVGGALGSAATGWLAGRVPPAALLAASAALLCALPVLAAAASRGTPAHGRSGSPAVRWSAAFAGARLTARSPFLLAIASIVAFYEMTSNVVDYQFNAAAALAYPDADGLARFLGRVNSALIAAAGVVQLTLTRAVLRRFGPGPGLLVLPGALALASLAFLAAPVLPIAAAMFFADGSLHYSINQTAKETLYTPASRQAKYEAKAFVDMLVYRGAKGASALLIAGFNVWLAPRGWPVQSLSLLSLACIAAWITAARAAGWRFLESSAAD